MFNVTNNLLQQHSWSSLGYCGCLSQSRKSIYAESKLEVHYDS